MNEQNAALKPYVIGLDLGGTNSVFGIVDARGEIKATTAIKTGNYNTAEEYVDACVEVLRVIIDQVGGIEKIKAWVLVLLTETIITALSSLLQTCLGLTMVLFLWQSCLASASTISPLRLPTMLMPLLSARWYMVWLVV